jgi:hypothetical protein
MTDVLDKRKKKNSLILHVSLVKEPRMQKTYTCHLDQREKSFGRDRMKVGNSM